MKKTISLTESQLRRLIENAINEVVYDGVSYHGTSPFDWAELAQIRRQKSYQDSPTELECDRQINAYARNKANAKELGYNGPTFSSDINKARKQTAQQHLNRSRAATTDAEKIKYAQMATDALGDVKGRGEKILRNMPKESIDRIVSETIKKLVNESYGAVEDLGHYDKSNFGELVSSQQ